MTSHVEDILKHLCEGTPTDQLSKHVSDCQLANDRIDAKPFTVKDVQRCIDEFDDSDGDVKAPADNEEAQVVAQSASARRISDAEEAKKETPENVPVEVKKKKPGRTFNKKK